jgi:hypothetical protein
VVVVAAAVVVVVAGIAMADALQRTGLLAEHLLRMAAVASVYHQYHSVVVVVASAHAVVHLDGVVHLDAVAHLDVVVAVACVHVVDTSVVALRLAMVTVDYRQ